MSRCLAFLPAGRLPPQTVAFTLDGAARGDRWKRLLVVFHGGTAVRDGTLVTNGGRILSVTATGESVEDARTRAYEAVDAIDFDGAQFRKDIARV